MLETSITKPIVQSLIANGWEVREERSVRMPNGDIAIADILARKPNAETGEMKWLVIEAKSGKFNELWAQAVRWLPYANLVYIATDLRPVHHGTRRAQDAMLKAKHIGVYVVHASGVVDMQLAAKFIDGKQTQLLAHAFDQVPAEGGPPAGSAAGKRMTPDRSKWVKGTAYLDQPGNDGATWAEIERGAEINETCEAAVKAIKSGDWRGVRAEQKPGCKTTFWRVKG